MSDFDDQDATTDALAALSGLVGWAYVVLWSASMYPQIYHHWLKKRCATFANINKMENTLKELLGGCVKVCVCVCARGGSRVKMN